MSATKPVKKPKPKPAVASTTFSVSLPTDLYNELGETADAWVPPISKGALTKLAVAEWLKNNRKKKGAE